MKRAGLALIAVMALGGGARGVRADGVADTRTKSAHEFEVTINYGRMTFPEQFVAGTMQTEAVSQTQWGGALRGILFDPKRKTVQGSVPAVWITFEVGVIGSDDATDAIPADDLGDGGVFYRQQAAAPWSLWSRGELELAAGLGGEFGVAVGRTPVTESATSRDERLLIAGAFAHAHVRGKLGSIPFNAQYQWAFGGLDYSEHRVHGRLVRGHWTLGIDLVVGRRDGDPALHRSLALSAGLRFGTL